MKKETLLFLDTETTGLSENDRLIQLAYKNSKTGKIVNELYSPGMPIGFESMSVHHITEEDVKNKPAFKGSKEFKELEELIKSGAIIVAHNAQFDIGMLEREGLKTDRFICTKKVAIAADEKGELPSHRLQYLRYFYKVQLDAQAHSADGDIAVLEKIYDRYAERFSIEEMLEISSNPSLILRFPFGKHKDQLITDVAKEDKSYLVWLQNEKKKESPKDEDWLYTLEKALK